MAPKRRVTKTVRKTPAPTTKSKSKSQAQTQTEAPLLSASTTTAVAETPSPTAVEALCSSGASSSAVAKIAGFSSSFVSKIAGASSSAAAKIAGIPSSAAAGAGEELSRPQTEPAECGSANGTKKKVIRKVIKKKIVKKLVPKGNLAAKETLIQAEKSTSQNPSSCSSEIVLKVESKEKVEEKGKDDSIVVMGEVKVSSVENPIPKPESKKVAKEEGEGTSRQNPSSKPPERKKEIGDKCEDTVIKLDEDKVNINKEKKVRKVIKKKIVKKLVPKGTLAAKKQTEETLAEKAEPKHGPESSRKKEESKSKIVVILEEKSRENPSSVSVVANKSTEQTLAKKSTEQTLAKKSTEQTLAKKSTEQTLAKKPEPKLENSGKEEEGTRNKLEMLEPNTIQNPSSFSQVIKECTKETITSKPKPKLENPSTNEADKHNKLELVESNTIQNPSFNTKRQREDCESTKIDTNAKENPNSKSEKEKELNVKMEEIEAMTERQKRRKTEIFIGGLDREAKEEDIKKVFSKAGEIVSVRMFIDNQTGKNKGFCFLRYKDPAQAKHAVQMFPKVEVCGKLCGAAAVDDNDTIFLGNIDKKWKKEDVMRRLVEFGIESIDNVTVMPDPKNPGLNRGFAFLDLETNRDAQITFKKLQKKDFCKGLNVKVSWAEPLNDPNVEVMQQVKSVFVECVPPDWDKPKLTETFKKYGEIKRIVLSRDIPSAKRKDFAFVNFTNRESAIQCVESFEKGELIEKSSKVDIKVRLAKPVGKGKQSKGGRQSNTSYDKEKTLTLQSHGLVKVDHSYTTHEPFPILQEQLPRKEDFPSYSRDLYFEDHRHALLGEKRPFSTLYGDPLYSDIGGHPRPRFEGNYDFPRPSNGGLNYGMGESSLSYYRRSPSFGYSSSSYYGSSDHIDTFQTKEAAYPPYRNWPYPRY